MSDTAEKLLDEAQLLVQQRGFNAFSFRDLSKKLGITNAGIHYHFPTKAALGVALVARYTRNFMAALTALDQRNLNAVERLRGFVDIYASALKSGRFCLCGIMASDALTLPGEVHAEVKQFFESVEQWLSVVVLDGDRKGGLALNGDATEEASLILASVEGAMLVAWPMLASDPDAATEKFTRITDRFINSLATT